MATKKRAAAKPAASKPAAANKGAAPKRGHKAKGSVDPKDIGSTPAKSPVAKRRRLKKVCVCILHVYTCVHASCARFAGY